MAWFLIALILVFFVTVLTVMQRARRGAAVDGLREDLRRRLELEYRLRREARAIRMSRADYVDGETARLVAAAERHVLRLARVAGLTAAGALPTLLAVLALQLGSTDSPLWGFAMMLPVGAAAAYLLYRFLLTDPGIRDAVLARRVRRRLGKP